MTTLVDELILGATNAWIYLFHRRLRRACIRHFGYFPDLARPRGHDALMQWRKVFDRNPLFVTFCDKLATREWARERMPGLKLPEILWVGKDPGALPLRLLRDDVVLKASSGCGTNYFPARDCWAPQTIRERAGHWLRRPRRRGEWGYGRLPPRLFIERLNGTPDELVDLTFRCQNGRIASAFAGLAWKTERSRSAYLSAGGDPLPGACAESVERIRHALPAALFGRAAAIASALSAGIDHVRVDLQIRGSEISLGEMSVYSSSGFGEEERVGVGAAVERQWIAEIDRSWFLATPQRWPLAIYQGAFRRWVRRRQAELGTAPATAAEWSGRSNDTSPSRSASSGRHGRLPRWR